MFYVSVSTEGYKSFNIKSKYTEHTENIHYTAQETKKVSFY